MTGIDISQLKSLVIKPVMAKFPVRWNTPAAVNLVAGISLVESADEYLQQLGGGPALSPWEVEPATHDDCYTNYLDYPAQDALKNVVVSLLAPGLDRLTNLTGNLFYACAMCRVRLIRADPPLPSAFDAAGMAAYWKAWYNTAGGAGSVDAGHIALFEQAIKA